MDLGIQILVVSDALRLHGRHTVPVDAFGVLGFQSVATRQLMFRAAGMIARR